MRTILSLFLILSSCFVFGQEFKKGYIINNNGDTIQGSIKEDVEEKLAQSINFKDQAGAIKVLSIGDMKEFYLEGEGNYRVVNYIDPLDSLKRKTHFAKFMMQGADQLFSFRRKDDLYFIVVNKDTSYLLYDDVKTPVGELIERGNYRSLLSFFSRECPKVSATASNLNFSEESILSFFVSLEKCNGNSTNTVIHYSKSKAQKNIILSAGGMQFDRRSEISIQVLGQYVIPSVNLKSSLVTGLVYLRSTHESTQTYTLVEDHTKYQTQIVELPLMFRYDFSQKLIQPYIYGGAGVAIRNDKETTTRISLISNDTESTGTTENSDVEGTVLVGGGINIRIAKGFFINFDWRYDLISHLPIVGLAYKVRLGK